MFCCVEWKDKSKNICFVVWKEKRKKSHSNKLYPSITTLSAVRDEIIIRVVR